MYFQGDANNHQHFEGDMDELLIYTRVLNACKRVPLFTEVVTQQEKRKQEYKSSAHGGGFSM
ncbi:MAG: hypothetical protein CSA96_02050 [Bacteroidetes bacterium]|nr:MAG: hypothetical protein CSA96_02050 [Bacteroidota bacterium]